MTWAPWAGFGTYPFQLQTDLEQNLHVCELKLTRAMLRKFMNTWQKATGSNKLVIVHQPKAGSRMQLMSRSWLLFKQWRYWNHLWFVEVEWSAWKFKVWFWNEMDVHLHKQKQVVQEMRCHVSSRCNICRGVEGNDSKTNLSRFDSRICSILPTESLS